MSSYELGFDDIARTVNSAVGTGARRSVEIGNIEPTDRGKTRPRYFTSRASSSAIMNASMGAITRNYTRRRVPPSNLETETTRAGERGNACAPDFRRVYAKSGRYL